MKLNRETKNLVKIGDVLRFQYGDSYVVSGIIESGRYNNGLSFTIIDTKTKRALYCYPSSKLYGAEIIPGTEEQ